MMVWRDTKWLEYIITARIRRMTEGNVFTLSTIAGGGGGGGERPRLRSRWGRGGTPSQVWMGGLPHPVDGTPSCWWGGGGRGVPHPRSRQGGNPIPGLDRGVFHPSLDRGVTPSKIRTGGYPGVPPHQHLMGVPPIQDWMGYPYPRLDGTFPPSPPSKTGWGTSSPS